MDAKALAKLKRAHSQHHSKKFHPNQISKLPSTGTGSSSSKKPSEKQVQERNKPSLPSNWERYMEEHDSDIDEPFQEGISQDTNVILPKSEGADYAYLISEAKAQSKATISLESFPSFDDVLDDLNQGFGSLLSAKGKSILSWVEDDNFVIDDKATASHEAPFLSLSLHNLAEELAKVDLSRRLFLEADLLPAELCINEAVQASGKQEVDTNDAEAVSNDNTGILGSHSPSERVTDMNKYGKILSSERNTSSSSNPVPVFEIKDSKCINQVRDEISISYRMDDSTSTEHIVNAVGHESKKPSQFQAEAAEAELDMLLDSLTETSLPTSHPARNSTHFNSSQDKTSTLSVEGSNTWSSQKSTGLSRSTMLSDNLDDALDDLLKETSNIKAGATQFNEVKAVPPDTVPSVHPVSKSKLLDDFDSWLDTI